MSVLGLVLLTRQPAMRQNPTPWDGYWLERSKVAGFLLSYHSGLTYYRDEIMDARSHEFFFFNGYSCHTICCRC